MTQTESKRDGIRELTNDEIAAVAGGFASNNNFLCFIEQKISCVIQQVFSFFCGSNQTPSDVALKHDISLLGRLDNGLGFYRFKYNGGDKAFVGVMAQEVQEVMPRAVVRGSDG